MQHRLGVTGGIGAGKSTVAALLKDMGAFVIDADDVSRRLTDAGGDAIGAVRSVFGEQSIEPSGAMNRHYMRELVFTDPKIKAQLEVILHPLVGKAIEAMAQTTKSELLVFDIPLLVESGRWRSRLDSVLVVDCEPHTQIDRVSRRSQLNAASVQAIMAAQAPRPTRLAAADHVVYNDTIDAITLSKITLALGRRWLSV